MEIRAPLTGIVLSIVAGEGSKVRTGDTVAVMQSMKMEINIESLTDGMVTHVMKCEGELVQADEILLVVDTAGDEAQVPDAEPL